MSQVAGIKEIVLRLPIPAEGIAEEQAGLRLGPARQIRPPAKPAGRRGTGRQR